MRHLEGQRFGRLLVLSRTEQKHGSVYLWRCRCDCGNECLADTNILTSGLKQSCGCLRRESRQHDLTGQRFGRLTVLGPTGEIRHACQVWNCQCDCGKVCEARTDALTTVITKSCGCLRTDTAREQQPHMASATFADGTHPGRIASTKLQANNTSGVRGVSWHRRIGKWNASIQFRGKVISLGYYDNLDDAARARKAGEEEYFKQYLDNRRT